MPRSEYLMVPLMERILKYWRENIAPRFYHDCISTLSRSVEEAKLISN